MITAHVDVGIAVSRVSIQHLFAITMSAAAML